MEGPTCIGCNNIIDEGSVIAFGDSLFHIKCFICAKCSEPVDCESNLLLLTNGKPVCENCSYCCSACKQVIRDEAIMTGDEAYHADCFRCVSCKNKIEDLVFTQTSKGIHCTPCHEIRKEKKQKRREEREKRLKKVPTSNEPITPSSQSKKALLPPKINTEKPNQPNNENLQHKFNQSIDPPTPSRSRNNSTEILQKPRRRLSKITLPNSPPLSVSNKQPNPFDRMVPSGSTMSLDDLNLSFFDNESTDLLNLTKTLGASIYNDIYGIDQKSQNNTGVNTIDRASRLLQRSLLNAAEEEEEEDDHLNSFPEPPIVSVMEQLKTELETANTKLSTMQLGYSKLKDASRQALEEMNRAKEQISKEVKLRQQQDYMMVQLKHQLQLAYQAKSMSRADITAITRSEIERVAKIRTELDRTCHELKSYRDVLVKDIDSLARQKQAGLEMDATIHLEEQQKALYTEIKSLQQDKEQVKKERQQLEFIRDQILHEIVLLNNKNLELTDLNSSLARRIEQHNNNTPSPSLSTELISPRTDNPQQPKVFKLKKKGNMFSKLSGKNLTKAESPTSPMTVSPTHDYRARQPEPIIQQHGSHHFVQTSFLRPTKCDTCGEKMWGLSELRCQGCTFTTHARCLNHVSPVCQGKIGLFGADLSDRALAEDRSVPLVIQKCVEAVEARGMDYEGIYRKSGGAAQIRSIIQSFTQDQEPIDLEDEEAINDVCAITSVLKQYFRELPNPLISYHLYSQFIHAVSTPMGQQNTKEIFLDLLSQLPKANYDTLKFLIQHLYNVQQRHEENLMTTKNLAMVFGPTLLRDAESIRDLVDMSSKNTVVEYLILNANELF